MKHSNTNHDTVVPLGYNYLRLVVLLDSNLTPFNCGYVQNSDDYKRTKLCSNLVNKSNIHKSIKYSTHHIRYMWIACPHNTKQILSGSALMLIIYSYNLQSSSALQTWHMAEFNRSCRLIMKPTQFCCSIPPPYR